MKFFIKTFGCRTNIAESEELAAELSKNYISAKTANEADFVIIRACAVTTGAETAVRRAAALCQRLGKTVFILGCFLKKIPGIKYFKTDAEITKHIRNNNCHGRDNYFRCEKSEPVCTKRTRAFIKIQSGCDFSCAFCVTRIIRGKSKNEPAEKILRQIKNAEAAGIKEIVITGTNILLRKDFSALIKKILAETSVPRIRFGSIDPRLITPGFTGLFKNPRLMSHLHLSIQSGSPEILRKMGRPADIKKIKSLALSLRRVNSLFNFSADIIVGFPGETEADFIKTLELAKHLRLSKIHYFQYSQRPTTPAAALKPLPGGIITRRLTKIKELDNLLQAEAKKRVMDEKLTILFENKKNNLYYGYTPNFVRVSAGGKNNLTNKLITTIIKTINLK
jgi:threonylcarbamoyladenosine tRNA methylthiotransferase MtaB